MAMPLPDAPATPALVVDPDVLDRNISRMAETGRTQGFALRPHAKSHKCTQIADRQLRSGAGGLSVATIDEAEAFARAGVDDLFIAYPVWIRCRQGATAAPVGGRCCPGSRRGVSRRRAAAGECRARQRPGFLQLEADSVRGSSMLRVHAGIRKLLPIRTWFLLVSEPRHHGRR